MEWKTETLGNIAFMTSGGTPSKKNPEYYKGGTIPWVRSGELENGAIRDTEIKITQAGLDASSAKIFPKGTLLIALYGATIGKLAYLDIDACTNQAVCGIFANDKRLSKSCVKSSREINCHISRDSHTLCLWVPGWSPFSGKKFIRAVYYALLL